MLIHSLVHGREDVEISGREKETPDDEDALEDEDHVAEVEEEADGDVHAEGQQEVAAAKDAERARSLKRRRNQLNLKEGILFLFQLKLETETFQT